MANYNYGLETEILPLNDKEALQIAMEKEDVAAVIIEGIQGVAGVIEPTACFYHFIKHLTQKHDALLIVDEVQSGFGRTGKFFAHQHAEIEADIVTTAKGMGNGFPVAGVLIHPTIKPFKGMLGTTFGGNHLACSAVLAVIETIKKEELLKNATKLGNYIKESLSTLEGVKKVRGKGLMIGIELEFPIKELQNALLKEGIFTGSSSDPYVIRILPPLNITEEEVAVFCDKFSKQLKILEPSELVAI
jgi:acetylornithine aminotransferase